MPWSRRGGVRGKISYPERSAAQEQIIRELLDKIQGLRYRQIVTGPTAGGRQMLAEYGLSSPSATMTINALRQTYPLEIQIGQPLGENGPLYLKTNATPNIMELAPEIMEQLDELGLQMISPRLLTFADQINRIEVSLGTQQVSVNYEDEIWIAQAGRRATAPEALGAKPPAALAPEFDGEDFVQQLRELEYLEVLPPDTTQSAFGPSAVLARIEFYHVMGRQLEVWTIAKYPGTLDALLLFRQSDQKRFLLSPRVIADLKKALQPATVPRVLREP